MPARSNRPEPAVPSVSTTTETVPPAPLALAARLPSDQPAPPDFERLAADVAASCTYTRKNLVGALRGALATGARILLYAERETTVAEVSRLNQDRVGRPWTEIGWVCHLLVERHGSTVPTLAHLNNCARAAKRAQEKHLCSTNYREILDYRRPDSIIDLHAAYQFSPTHLLESTLASESPESDLPSDANPDEIDHLVDLTFHALSSRIARLVAITHQHHLRLTQRRYGRHLEELNQQLAMLNLVIVQKGKT